MNNLQIDLTKLQSNRDRILRWITSQGAVICTDLDKREEAKRYFMPIALLFPEYALRLSAIYVYKQSEQKGDLRNSDAINWKDVTKDGNGVLYAIGISIEALQKGAEYATLCLIHELCHIEEQSHGTSFHRLLNSMIQRYNSVMGTNIVNDNNGLPMRHDSRRYDPLSNSVSIKGKEGGKIFRTSGRRINS